MTDRTLRNFVNGEYADASEVARSAADDLKKVHLELELHRQLT